MNRRTFIKLTGVTTALLATPSLFAEKEIKRVNPEDFKFIETHFGQQWISFLDKTPKVGQKIIITDSWEGMSLRDIRGGVVQDLRKIKLGVLMDSKFNKVFITVPMKKDFEYREYSDFYIYNIFSEEGEKVINSREWLKSKKEPFVNDFKEWDDSIDKKVWYNETSYRKSYYYWLPINGEYPTTLPPIPKHKGLI